MVIALSLFALAIALPARGHSEITPTPTVAARQMSDPTAWMRPPPPGPTQADQGAFTYWKRCMVCHGDRGQGLALFRAAYPPQDQNCCQCHGGPQSLAGFAFPDAPAIIGPNTLTRFENAADLYDYLSTRMPYHDPGALSSAEYWNLVAYLLKQRGAVPGDVHVNASNARFVPVHPRPVPQFYWLVGAAMVLVLLGLGLVWLKSRSLAFQSSHVRHR